jgi:mannose-1-phosphate guanylyltransferase
MAARTDGILVSDKERSGFMKPYVEKIGGRLMYADKDWGSCRIIDMTSGVLTASLTVKAGDTVIIASGVKHTLKAKTEISLIEVQSGSEISKDDKIIFE